MTVDIEVEDEAWRVIQDVEELAERTVMAALEAACIDNSDVSIAILFADDQTVAKVNGDWRGKASPTNVLSFPAPKGLPQPPGELRPLGDIILASGVVMREAAEQGKPLPHHVAHLIVHGVLHLLGHDHIDDEDASRMEHLETEILKGLDISNPYERQ